MPGPIAALGLQLGAQAASGTISGIQGAIFGKGADRRQYQLQEKLQRLGIYGAKEMSDYNYAKELQMWKDTNYKAQVEELEKAGLNPGLLYGMSGGGGTTTGTPNTGVPQGAAGRSPMEVQGMGINYAQMALLKAQKENIEADTANKQADTGVKQATVPKIAAEKDLLGVETDIKKIEREFQSETLQNRESIVNLELSKLIEDVQIRGNERKVSDATINEQIQTIKQRALGAFLQNGLTQQQIEHTKSQITQIAETVAQGWKSLDLKEKELKVQSIIKEVEQIYMGYKILGSNFLRDHNPKSIADQIDKIVGTEKPK